MKLITCKIRSFFFFFLVRQTLKRISNLYCEQGCWSRLLAGIEIWLVYAAHCLLILTLLALRRSHFVVFISMIGGARFFMVVHRPFLNKPLDPRPYAFPPGLLVHASVFHIECHPKQIWGEWSCTCDQGGTGASVVRCLLIGKQVLSSRVRACRALKSQWE